ncbi:MAG: hypothetical protein WBF67_05050 [Olleya sp.]
MFQNNGAYPYLRTITTGPTKILNRLISWFGDSVINLPNGIDIIEFTGSGDTTADYVMLLLFVIIGLCFTVIWSLIDYKRTNYSALWYFLTVGIRFYIAFMLINYGMAKLLKSQFPYPHLGRLVQRYGESSPMGLAWTFLGFSFGYNIFMGIAEIASALLLFKRTMVLGAIITLMTTANVMAINFFYDVPVKITSSHLVMMTILLLIPNIKVLFQLFFKNESIQLKLIAHPKKFSKKRGKLIMISKFLFFLVFIYASIPRISYGLDKAKAYNNKPTIEGVYMIDQFTFNNN